ncbi:MAG: hypothetical protein JJT85_06030 [Chromatiales bacterium]|nr:hypothetical protein [Chromatiales bacterium]
MADIAFWTLLACAFVLGLVVGRLMTTVGKVLDDRRARKLQHQVRALEAGLRVAQKNAGEATARASGRVQQAEQALGERDDLVRRLSRLESEAQDLKSRLRNECSKTAGLRRKLSDTSEAHARTLVELGDLRNELDIARYSSDAASDELLRIKSERDELEAELGRIRTEQAGGRALPGHR